MNSSVIDAILSAWTREEESLSYSRIKRHIVGKGIIKKTNDRSLSRWLKNLTDKGILKKTEEGYFLEMKPKAYQVFDYLSELRRKYDNYIYEGEVGGLISHVCALTYLNFDETLLQKDDERQAFDTISVRLAELFWALYELRNAILKRRCGLAQLKLPDDVIRETLFGMLTSSIGEHHATEEIVEKYSTVLRPREKQVFDNLWKTNKPSRKVDYVDRLDHELFFDKIEENLESYKKELKKTASIDLEKYTVEELIKKFVQINEWIQRNHAKEMQEKHSFAYTQEESELEANYRTAILTKVAEAIKALETSLEDFAVVLTRHPATMNQYFTPEHILYEAMEWARAPPKDEFLKNLWQETLDEEKTFESMVAERISHYRSINIKTLEELRSRPWVQRELSKFGNFDKIIKLYKSKIKKQRQNEEKAPSLIGFLGKSSRRPHGKNL